MAVALRGEAMNPARVLWFGLVPLFLINAVLWQWYTHSPKMAITWFAMALGARWMFKQAES